MNECLHHVTVHIIEFLNFNPFRANILPIIPDSCRENSSESKLLWRSIERRKVAELKVCYTKSSGMVRSGWGEKCEMCYMQCVIAYVKRCLRWMTAKPKITPKASSLEAWKIKANYQEFIFSHITMCSARRVFGKTWYFHLLNLRPHSIVLFSYYQLFSRPGQSQGLLYKQPCGKTSFYSMGLNSWWNPIKINDKLMEPHFTHPKPRPTTPHVFFTYLF